MASEGDPLIESNSEETQDQSDRSGHDQRRRIEAGAAKRDSTAGNRIDATRSRVRGSIIGGDNVDNRRTSINTGGIIVAIVAGIALLGGGGAVVYNTYVGNSGAGTTPPSTAPTPAVATIDARLTGKWYGTCDFGKGPVDLSLTLGADQHYMLVVVKDQKRSGLADTFSTSEGQLFNIELFTRPGDISVPYVVNGDVLTITESKSPRDQFSLPDCNLSRG